MNTTLIQMDKEQAKQKLEAYRSERHKDTDRIYRQCEEAYSALAEGVVLISLTQAIRDGGFDEKMRPKIAFAPADRTEVRFRWDAWSNVCEFNTAFRAQDRGSPRLIKRINLGRRHEQFRDHKSKTDGKIYRHDITVEGYAMIPMVPADVRPATGRLRDWCILWEVEKWADQSLTAPPPRDPYLLKHLAGDLYAVIAEWDLTDLERAIMQHQVPES